ncbi:MAG: helix-turn-helix domain-containing protein [Thermodesulfovibrionales bacterium]
MKKKRIITSREIGAKLKELRKARNISQEAFAEILGVTYQQVQRYEAGTNKFNVENIQTVAHALGVPVSVFLPDEETVTELSKSAFLTLNADEMKVLRLYRQVPDTASRNLVVQVARLASKK